LCNFSYTWQLTFFLIPFAAQDVESSILSAQSVDANQPRCIFAMNVRFSKIVTASKIIIKPGEERRGANQNQSKRTGLSRVCSRNARLICAARTVGAERLKALTYGSRSTIAGPCIPLRAHPFWMARLFLAAIARRRSASPRRRARTAAGIV